MKPQLTPLQAEDEAMRNLETLKDLGDQFVENKEKWLRHILLLASTLFGVLVSLHTTSSGTLYSRLAFLAALSFLALGILCTAGTLYGSLKAIARLKKKFSEEASSALNELRKTNVVFVGDRKIFVVCEWLAYIFYLIGILSLLAYVALSIMI